MSRREAALVAYEQANELIPKDFKLPDLQNVEAARKLYRFAMGKMPKKVETTSGNRYTWMRGGVLKVNVDHPLHRVVHDLSHLCHDLKASHLPSDHRDAKPHSPMHARLERDMAREVIARGWLEGGLTQSIESLPAEPAATLDVARAAKIADARDRIERIDILVEQWNRKLKRATTAIAKYEKERRRLTKRLDNLENL